MPAGNYDLNIEQGATLSRPLVWKDGAGDRVDLTGYSARMQIRNTYDAPVLLELTSGDGSLIITPKAGMVTIFIDANTTAAITWTKGRYDLELVASDGVVTRLLEGAVYVSREITK
jgi:hypothetical protein